ncbi:unnamed protein product, partial [Didymodactylos carnosus]
MITNQTSYDTLTENEKADFDQIYVCDNDGSSNGNFNYDKLKDIVEKIIKSDDKVEIFTDDEYCMTQSIQLRQDFSHSLTNADPIEIINIFRNKALMKQRLIDNGLKYLLPKYQLFNSKQMVSDCIDQYIPNLICDLGLSIFCKPTTECGSKGTCLLKTEDEIRLWLMNNRNGGDYEFDEYITGDLYHCDSIIHNNKIHHVEICRYMYPCFEFLNGKLCASIVLPSDDARHDELITEIKEVNYKILNALCERSKKIPSGITHLELFRTNNEQRLIFVEVAARPPG